MLTWSAEWKSDRHWSVLSLDAEALMTRQLAGDESTKEEDI